MGMLQGRNPPHLPQAPQVYDAAYMNQLLNVLTQFMQQQNAVQVLSLAGINLNVDTLPTDAAYATLRSGDVYRDTTAGNVLKVHP